MRTVSDLPSMTDSTAERTFSAVARTPATPPTPPLSWLFNRVSSDTCPLSQRLP
ncbi:hypothetical protein Nans01_03350 [Nocardiopsis ansamitocini]|uniref:Uncharacterized protein n=1 Tax=Nocardiopsis ansamitocini TaxID=1670832 RepID=A0A9W6P2L9_9ACTN|nr:hypothetical protein Nans01_03350 [Nocardiopsis ansamitocini]